MKSPASNRLIWVAAGAGIGATTAALAAQRRFTKRIAADREGGVLSDPPTGTPLEVRSPDGTRLHAELFGPDDGDPVVLGHGWTESLQYWIYQIRALSDRGLRVIAYDLRGHGEERAGG